MSNELVETYVGMLACLPVTTFGGAHFVCSMGLSKFCADILVLVNHATTSRMVYILRLDALSATHQGLDASNVHAVSCSDWSALQRAKLGHPLLKGKDTLEQVKMHLTTWEAAMCLHEFASYLDKYLATYLAKSMQATKTLPGTEKPKTNLAKGFKSMVEIARQVTTSWLRPKPKAKRGALSGQGLFLHSLVCFERSAEFFFALHNPNKQPGKRSDSIEESKLVWSMCNTLRAYQDSTSEVYVSFPGTNLRMPLVMYPEKNKEAQKPWPTNMWWQ